MNWASLNPLVCLLRFGVVGTLIFASTSALSQTLEQELENWKKSSATTSNYTASRVIRTTTPDAVSEITKIDQIKPSALFSNKVSDPKIKMLLEEAYAKPNAAVIHATVH